MITTKKIIPIFYTLDDNFTPFMGVSITSILMKSNKQYFYKFYALHTGLTEKRIKEFDIYNTENSSIDFIDVTEEFKKINKNLCVRDNWTETIFYRFLIPSMFPQYDKAIYIDGDTVLVKDISLFYNIDLENNLIGGVADETIASFDVFREYVNCFLNMPYDKYINDGVLLINCKKCREENLVGQFVNMQKKVSFEVAPDQDFMNVICYKKIKYVSAAWNKQPFDDIEFDENEIGLIHYNLNLKPWHFDNIRYENYFWEASKLSPFYNEIIEIKKNYGEKDKAIAKKQFEHLVQIALSFNARANNSPIKKEDFFHDIRTEA